MRGFLILITSSGVFWGAKANAAQTGVSIVYVVYGLSNLSGLNPSENLRFETYLLSARRVIEQDLGSVGEQEGWFLLNSWAQFNLWALIYVGTSFQARMHPWRESSFISRCNMNEEIPYLL